MASWMSSVVSTITGCAASAVSSIASSAAAVIIEKIVSTGISYLSNHMLPADTDAELKRLQTALPQIREVMSVAEAMKVIDSSSGAWFEQFRNAVEASEDVLDELEYKELEDMVKNQDEAGGTASGSKKRKLCHMEDDTLKRMREAVKMLDQAAANVDRIHRRAAELGVCSLSELQREASKILRRETTSFLVERQVFGREIEKGKIIDWLKKSTRHHISCLSIVGPGGLGKTTLAQFAYQEIRGTKHFDKTIWICVSTNFNVDDITRKILDELGTSSCHDKPLNALHENLKENIYSKKIFIVLDDVWDDERRDDWEKLFAPLKFVQKGSKILFTTRMKSVENMLSSVINTEHESVPLKGLGEEDLGFIFKSYAFHGFNNDGSGDLQEIGDQIIKMLKGNPLAAKMIGCLLNSRMDRYYWSRFLGHESIFNIEQAKNVMEVLKLSYYHLPTDLQACFKYCSIFQKDHRFDKDELIKMWMAAGFISQQSGQRQPEDIGEDYFNHLLRKSFFEYARSSRDVSERYVMHDLLHELAQNVANGECCRIEPNDKEVAIPSSVRHILIHETELERVSHLENLRSLVITTSLEWKQDPFVLPANIINRNLRLLKIYARRSCKLPQEMSMLVHLRFLSINLDTVESFEHFLPVSIFKLYHLQVLEINNPISYGYLLNETSGITNLFSLRYLSLPEDMMQNIHGVHKLTSLQKLTFCVGKENGRCINELGILNNLQNLSICNIENVGGPTEAKSADLLKKKNLMSLSLKWTEDSNAANPEQIIDNLQPHQNLMNLTIENYKGQNSPSWMENSQPSKLLSLRLHSCPMWKIGLISWKMPYLKVLEISDLPKLDKIPYISLCLCEFRVTKVGLTSLPNLYDWSDDNTTRTIFQKSLLRIVEIRQCPILKSLNGFLQQANLDLQAIETLIIENCERLVGLPSQGFGKLTSLKYLTLRYCPKLLVKQFEGNLLPEKVQGLYMGNCGELDISLLEASFGLTNLTSLIVSNSGNITSSIASQSSFKSLKWLKINQCANLIELSFSEEGMNQNKNFIVSKMTHLVVGDCPNLTRFPNLPLSLTSFIIFNVGISALPEHFQDSDSLKGPSTASKESSLRKVQIEDCPNLRSLKGFLQQDIMQFQFLESIEIENCRKLIQLPIGAFGKFVSLIRLLIRDCPILVPDVQGNPLPMKLNYLGIGNCGELDVALLESASCLASLTELYIRSSEYITHIPSSENSFRSLRSLSIIGCDKVVEQSSQEQAHGVNSITDLQIDHLSLLLIEPIRSLRFVSKLFVYNCSQMAIQPAQWLLQNSSTLRVLEIWKASSLKSLPATMVRLTALESLSIFQANLLEELPDLPVSLKSLRISGASSLKSLPPTMAKLTALEELHIYNANLLEDLPELPPSLHVKTVRGSGGRLL